MPISGFRSYYPNVSDRRYAFVFVCQQGELEAAALLLAASLRRFLRSEHELIACVPEPSEIWGEPSGLTHDLLAVLGVRVASITNEFGPERPTANKITCMQVSTDADKIVFCDSDMLCLRDFAGDELLGAPFSAVPAYGESFDQWDAAFGAVGLPVPPRTEPTLMSNELSVPYFNSGFVSVDTSVRFGDAWLDCMRAIVESESVAPSRFEDQASLALAVATLEIEYEYLDERFNYPQLHKPVDARNLPYLSHYSHRAFLRHEPVLETTVASLVEEQPRLLESMEADEHWAPLARHYRHRPVRAAGRRRAHDVVITGMASSGVAFLGDLIDAHDNCVVFAEPKGRVRAGLVQPVPWPLAIFYRLERIRLIEALEPDTGLASGRAFDVSDGGMGSSSFENEDFVLATTGTHPYLARLDGIRTVLPDARIVVCVRGPFDTVAAWKRCTDDHAISELFASSLVPNPDDPWLTEAQQATISQLGVLNSAEARAVLWRHFAEVVLSQLDHVMLVRYGELAANPERVVDQVLSGFNPGRRSQPIPSQTEGDRSNLDEADERAIRAICSQAAFDLGLVG
jgi:hypothetical protein